MLLGKALGALADKHHVRAFFENNTGQPYGIFDTTQTGNGARAQSGCVHHDGVAFDLTVEIEMRTVASVEDRVVLKNHDGGLDGVEGVAVSGEDGPAGFQGSPASCLACFDGFIGDVPGATMNDERGRHEE